MSEDPMEFVHRAELVKLQIDRVMLEAIRAARAGDEDRVAALHHEMELLTANMEGIREEQLISMLPKPPKRKWWRRVRSNQGGGR